MMKAWLLVSAGLGLFGALYQPAIAGNLIKNGSFEVPVVAQGQLQRFSAGATIGQWLVIGDSGNVDVFGPGFTYQGCTVNGRKGSQLLDLTGSSDSAMGVQQKIKTVPGSTYQLSLYIGSINNACIDGNTSTVVVLVDGSPITQFTYTAKRASTVATWGQFSVQFQAKRSKTTIALLNGDPPADTYNGVDGVTITEVQ